MIPRIRKYPRTQHLEGSRLGPGDDDLESVPFAALERRHVVIEEKIDGANAAIRFARDGTLLLQSRGHYLTGGARELHFDLLKQWAQTHADALRAHLSQRYVMYGEWVYAKHTVFYDALPHYFLEFDVLDSEDGTFLSTERRRALLAGAPIESVPVLSEGPVRSLAALVSLVGPSRYKTTRWLDVLRAAAIDRKLDADRVLRETDLSNEAEGLYIKVEEEGRVLARYKWVRQSFLTSVVDSGTHWLSRPIIPNGLASHVDMFGASS